MRWVTYDDAAPAVEPVSREEAKVHCRVSHNADDALIDGYIAAAREYAETNTRRAFVQRTVVAYYDSFPTDGSPLILPKPPLASVTKVEYVAADAAADDTYTEWARLDPDDGVTPRYVAHVNGGLPGLLVLATGYSWPDEKAVPRAVRVTMVCGFAAATEPVDSSRFKAAKSAILLIVGSLYEHREEVITGTIATRLPFAAEDLLRQVAVPEA